MMRPQKLADIIGQEDVVANLKILMEAAKTRKAPLPHILFHGPPGIGKTTFAQVMANEMDANILIATGPMLERAGDLVAMLTHLREGDVLLFNTIHRLSKAVEKTLCSAMEDFVLDIVVGKEPVTKNIRLSLPKFTVIGATTRLALITAPMYARFGGVYRLDFYSLDAMIKIVTRVATSLNISIDEKATHEIAIQARGVPRSAVALLKGSR
jgi:holliday junction DNA helicase RuvB